MTENTPERGKSRHPSVSLAPRLVEYAHVRWNADWCKRCLICVECCPKLALVLRDDAIIEVEGCNRCGLCERLCPDLAIEVIQPRGKGSDEETDSRQ